MTETETNEVQSAELIAAIPPFAERLHPDDTVPIQIRALTFLEVRYMRAKVKGIEDDEERAEMVCHWLLKFGLVAADSLGLSLRRETFELNNCKTDALTDLSLNEFLQQPNGVVESATAAVTMQTFPGEQELDRLDFTTLSAGALAAGTKAKESVTTATQNGKLD